MGKSKHNTDQKARNRRKRQARREKEKQNKSRLDSDQISERSAHVKGVRLPSWKQPEFRFVQDKNCDPAFATLIKGAFSKVDLEDRSQFTEEECYLFRYHRMNGVPALIKQLRDLPEISSTIATKCAGNLGLYIIDKLGQLILDIIGTDVCVKWFPYNDFQLISTKNGHGFVVRCQSLSRHVASGQTFYYSTAQHTVTIKGKTHQVAFSEHAIHRIGERLTGNPASYGALGDIFAFLNYCQYFEAVTLYPDQVGFTFYDKCTPGFLSFRYIPELIGKINPEKKYYHRVGYCPVVEESGFFLAKTLLYPGYRGTPEYGLIHNASLSFTRKQAMFTQCEDQTMRQLMATKDFSLLKWFHENGIPQVKSFKHEIFDYDFEPIQKLIPETVM